MKPTIVKYLSFISHSKDGAAPDSSGAKYVEVHIKTLRSLGQSVIFGEWYLCLIIVF